MTAPALIWLRDDLRLADNPALRAAAGLGQPAFALHVRPLAMGGAEGWWVEESLNRLADDLARIGVPLVRRDGDPVREVTDAAVTAGSRLVMWNDSLDPDQMEWERRVEDALDASGIEYRRYAGTALFPPDALTTASGAGYRVFTPFWRRCLSLPAPSAPLPAPEPPFPPVVTRLPGGRPSRPRPAWAREMASVWTPGEAAARRRLDDFLSRIAAYPATRDRPAAESTSRLSPHLRFGEMSVRQVWHAVRAHAAAREDAGTDAFLRQLAWREFARHLRLRHPDMTRTPLDRRFAAFPWRRDDAGLEAWRRGRTGYPIVDAGMRQLWRTGFMHNRVRMIAGSFLVKDLLQPWHTGHAWFADTLVDADAAANAMNWQWVAGCGADAAPFFRVFNPVTQGETNDPDGTYVRTYVPELSWLPSRWIHKPWMAPADVLSQARVRLGTDYPLPIVDHARARRDALAAYALVTGNGHPIGDANLDKNW